MKKKIIIISSSIAAVLLVAAIVFFTSKPKPIPAFRFAKTEVCQLALNVTASGYIQPVLKVDVGTQVSGIVNKIYVDFNSNVKKGQLLAELDKQTLSEMVLQRKAALDDAESNVTLAEQNFQRIKTLFGQKAATEADYQSVVNKLQTARNAVTNAKANLQQAQVNLGYANIYSPISGRVLNRAVDEGQTVAASFNTPTLFTIANDLTKMQIEANVDEADIGSIKKGQKVSFSVDTYPGEEFSGTVNQIRLEPVVTSNVVTYTVIISVPNPEEKLFPGMTANVSITTQSPEGICIPSEALYFTPDPKTLGDIRIEGSEIKGNKVWVRTPGGLKAIAVKPGASDGVRTIILNGLKENQEIIAGITHPQEVKKESFSIAPKPPKR